jgi:hypothetical protein
MANTQTAVPLFVANAVLTAAQQNISAGTGVPVFATTVTRDAAFGGSNKALAEGQLCYLESTNVTQQYNGSSWETVGPATAGALTLVSATTIGTTVSSVTVSNCFSATYDTYKILVSGGVGSTTNYLRMTLGAATTRFSNKLIYGTVANNTVSGIGNSLGSYWDYVGAFQTTAQQLNMDIYNPFLNTTTQFTSFVTDIIYDATNLYGTNAGTHDTAASNTGFTLTTASGTLTGGKVYVYGYAKA